MSGPLLYDFLPAIYRMRDEELAGYASPALPPLKALFGALQVVFDELHGEIADLYDDWFIETCKPHMFHVFAEALALGDLEGLERGGADTRALLANIIGYRQRKGTVAALSGVTRDVTGWMIDVVDGLRSTAANVRVDDRPFPGFLLVRSGHRDGPIVQPDRFSVDVGNNISGLRCVRLDVWQRKGAPTTGVVPAAITADGRGGTFSALGHDKALMRPIRDLRDGDYEFSLPLTRVAARAELAAHGSLQSLRVTRGGVEAQLRVADLLAWHIPPRERRPQTVYIDPELGRLLAPEPVVEYRVDAYVPTYDGLGAGVPSRPWSGHFAVSLLALPEGNGLHPTLADRIVALPDKESIRIVLGDSGTHRPNGDAWNAIIPAACRHLSIESAPGTRPTLLGPLVLSAATETTVELRGLNIGGSVICSGNLNLSVVESTIFATSPGGDAIDTRGLESKPRVQLALSKSIVGGVTIGDGIEAHVRSSIVTGAVRTTASARGSGRLDAARSTFIGPVEVVTLVGSDTLFVDDLRVQAQHAGYMRFCAYPPSARIPQRYHCVPIRRQVLASRSYGRLDFARVRDDAQQEIRTGASDHAEIGAFNRYAKGRRVENLERVMSEFLPDGVGVKVRFRS